MKWPKIMNDRGGDVPKYWRRYRGKERLYSEQDEITRCIGVDYPVMGIIWYNDADQSEPHIHVVDMETRGNKINWAYSMITGKALQKKHGTMITKVSDDHLKLINELISDNRGCQLGSRWKLVMREWNSENSVRINLNRKMPVFCN